MRRHCVAMLGIGLCLLLGAAGAINAQPHWRLQIEQRFVLDDGPSEPIKDLRDFAVGRDGRLYVLENTVKQVHMYAPTGRFVKSFSRSGSGPGELRNANGIITAPDASLWVNDHGNARITNFSKDGAYVRQMRSNAHGYGYRWTGFVDANGVLHDELISAQRGSLERRKPDGSVIDTVRSAPCLAAGTARKTVFRAQSKNGSSMGTQIPFVQQSLRAIDPRGAQWCMTSEEYRIARVEWRTGKVAAQVSREVKRNPVPRTVRDAAIQRIRGDIAKYESSDADYSLVPNEYPYVSSLTVDDRGRLWALRPQADSMRTEFDVFDERGRYLATATLPGRTSAYARLLVRGDLAYAVTFDSDDVPSIVRARIIPGGR